MLRSTSSCFLTFFLLSGVTLATQVDRLSLQPALTVAYGGVERLQELASSELLEEDHADVNVTIGAKGTSSAVSVHAITSEATANSSSFRQRVIDSLPNNSTAHPWQHAPKEQRRVVPVDSDGGIVHEMIGSSFSDQPWHQLTGHVDAKGIHNEVVSVDPNDRNDSEEVSHGTGGEPEQPRNIWNASEEWVTIVEWHPAGVISNVNGGRVVWHEEASFMSFNFMLFLSLLAYPALWIGVIIVLTVLVSVCLATGSDDTAEVEPEESSSMASLSQYTGGLPLLPFEKLSPRSQRLYMCWRLFCRAIPALTVFGMPLILVLYCGPRPQEVFSVLTILTTGCMYTNSLYISCFGVLAYLQLRNYVPLGERVSLDSTVTPSNPQQDCADDKLAEVIHWVILPQYKEDFDVVSMAIQSVAQGRLAKSSICLCLAMEEREEEAKEKVKQYKAKFSGAFLEIFATYHPANLPNDPPGKASNTAWAFSQLKQKFEKSEQDASNIVLTVSDADSDFHQDYFELLAQGYLAETEADRDLRLWQSPVFHMKNYHRQPAPVLIGTMFTSLVELGGMADPNAVRFPYSTYSLSFNLASSVGGWDPQWIAEDWHMGIKCFLYTFGKTKVLPIMVPTMNYTPEESGWFSTIHARWVQAKRHALGFSDMSYYFMMLPLIFGHVVAECTRTGNPDKFCDFFKLLFSGLSLIVKIINVHVLLGIASTYGFLAYVLGEIMHAALEGRGIDYFFDRVDFCPFALVAGSGCFSIVVIVVWICLYNLVKDRIEEDESSSFVFKSNVCHGFYVFFSLQMFGWMFLLALSMATCKAALSNLLNDTFEYEVASKPTKETRLKS